jgi:type II secretory pathway component HofQ
MGRREWLGSVVLSGAVSAELLCVAVGGSCSAWAEQTGEARVTLDVKDADFRALTEALARVADMQVVFDPGVSCRLTVSVRGARWADVLHASLAACGLGLEEDGGILRIARRETLVREARDRRALKEAQFARSRGRVEMFRLSYAKARDMAPLLEHMLGERADVVFDERTNTLIITD